MSFKVKETLDVESIPVDRSERLRGTRGRFVGTRGARLVVREPPEGAPDAFLSTSGARNRLEQFKAGLGIYARDVVEARATEVKLRGTRENARRARERGKLGHAAMTAVMNERALTAYRSSGEGSAFRRAVDDAELLEPLVGKRVAWSRARRFWLGK